MTDSAAVCPACGQRRVLRPTREQLERIMGIMPPILEAWRLVARQHGYAISVHGSLARDIDVVAVPWVEHASDAETLVAALVAADPSLVISSGPTEQPHGRRSWSIPGYFGPGYFDLSVMPRRYHAEAAA